MYSGRLEFGARNDLRTKRSFAREISGSAVIRPDHGPAVRRSDSRYDRRQMRLPAVVCGRATRNAMPRRAKLVHRSPSITSASRLTGPAPMCCHLPPRSRGFSGGKRMPQLSAVAGLRVLELGNDAIAAFAGRWFADSGATVIKVDNGAARLGHEAIMPYLNRGKDIVALDLGDAEGRRRLHELARTCHAFIADLTPMEIEDLGLDQVAGGHLRVRTFATPFGRTGPYRDFPSSSATLLALSGHTYMTGHPQKAPLTLAGEYVAYQVGLIAYSASLAALLKAPSDRKGMDPVTVDICSLEVLSSLHQYTTVRWSYAHRIRMRRGNQYDGTYPITILPCADGWFGICIVQSFWEAFAKWLNPGWLDDPRFTDTVARAENADALDSEIARAIASRRKHDLEREGQLSIRVPCGAVNTPGELLNDPHLNERRFWSHEVIEGRDVLVPGPPFRFLEDSVQRAAEDIPVGRRF